MQYETKDVSGKQSEEKWSESAKSCLKDWVPRRLRLLEILLQETPEAWWKGHVLFRVVCFDEVVFQKIENSQILWFMIYSDLVLDFLLFVILPVKLNSFDIKIWKGIASNKMLRICNDMIWYVNICVICSDMWCGVVWRYVVINAMSSVIICDDTLPKFDIALKSYLPNRKIVFQPPFFRGYVKLQGCMCWLVMICADMFCKMESNESLVDVARNSQQSLQATFFLVGCFYGLAGCSARYRCVHWIAGGPISRYPSTFMVNNQASLGVSIIMLWDLWSLKLLFPSPVKCHILTLPRSFFSSSPLKIYRDPKGNE